MRVVVTATAAIALAPLYQNAICGTKISGIGMIGHAWHGRYLGGEDRQADVITARENRKRLAHL
jgi:hypothetical protein